MDEVADIEARLNAWKVSLCDEISVASLISKNPEVYKWKSMARVWYLREATFWRVEDLLRQSLFLHQKEHALGARILLRSAFETLATLAFMNQSMKNVILGKFDFHEFSNQTSKLVAGSKLGGEGPVSINVVTVLNKVDKKYPGILGLYAGLSESSHPSFEGLLWGYSRVDHDLYETNFTNRWMELYGSRHLNLMRLCMECFHHEYDDIWPSLVEKWKFGSQSTTKN